MKKYIAIILSVIMALVPFSSMAQEEVENFFDTLVSQEGEIAVEIDPDADLSYMEILEDLGIISAQDREPENVFKTVSRAKTVHHILKLLGYSDDVIAGNDIVGYFTDVTAETPYASEIEFATKTGIVSGYGDNTFRPGEQISYNEVLKIVIAALGYTHQAEERGGYYSGYYLTAFSLKLTKNAPNEQVNIFGTVARILYNALNVKTLSGEYTKDAVSYQKNDTTVLNDKFDVKMYTGIVEAVGKTSIYGFSNETESQLTISGQRFENGLENASDYIGKMVRFYVNTNSTGFYKEVICAEVMPVNSTISFPIEDVEKATADRIYYVDAAEKRKNIRIDDGYLLYNNRGMAYDPEMVRPQQAETEIPMDGEVICIDNNGDNKYDVVIVNSYWSFMADSVIAKQGMISDYYFSQYRPDNKYYNFYKPSNLGNNEQYVYKNGKEIKMSDIKSKNIVSVQKSSNGISDTVNLTVTDKKISGTITMIDGDGTVKIGETEYELSAYYKYMQANSGGEAPYFSLGDTVNVYLDMFGKIAGCESRTAKSSGNYYYMLDYMMSGSKLKLEVMNESGTVEEFIVAGDVKYQDRGSNSTSNMSVKDIYTQWTNRGYLNAPIKMKVKDEKVEYIGIVDLINLVDVDSKSGNIITSSNTQTYTNGRFESDQELKVGSSTVTFGIGYRAPGEPWDETTKRAENYNLPINEDYTYKMTQKLETTNPHSSTNFITAYVDMVYVADYDEGTGEIGLLVIDTLPSDEYHDAVFTSPANTAEEMGRKYPELTSLANEGIYPGAKIGTARAKFFNEWARFDIRDTRSSEFLLVNKVVETENEDGELVKMVVGLVGGKNVTLQVRPDAIFWSTTNATSEAQWFQPVDIYDRENNRTLANRYYENFVYGRQPEILPGDVYAFVKKIDGSIQELYFVGNMDEGPTVFGTDSSAMGLPRHHMSFGGNMKWGFCFGAVHSIDSSNVYLRDRSNGSTAGDFQYEDINGVNTQKLTLTPNALYMWDFTLKKFIVADKSEHLIPSYMRYRELPEYKYSHGTKAGQVAENNVWMIINEAHWQPKEMIFADYYDAERYYED